MNLITKMGIYILYIQRFGYYYTVNKGGNKFESTVTMNQMGGLKLMKPFRGN